MVADLCIIAIMSGRILTWHKGVKQWCKQVNGRRIYFGKGCSKTNREDYNQAVQRYRDYLLHLEQNPEASASTPRQLAASTDARSERITYSPKQCCRCFERWIRGYETKVTLGEIKRSRVVDVRYFVEPFVDWYGSRRRLTNLKSTDLTDYRDHQISLIENGKYSVNTVFQRLWNLKAFLKWAWREEIIQNLPRNIDTVLKIKQKRSEIVFLNWKAPKRECRQLWNACKDHSEQAELWFLLALNCGFYPKDISDLRMDEVLWRKGKFPKIVRKRSKTGQHSEHLLWGRTFDLIKKLSVEKYGSKSRCFTRRDGSPLYKVVSRQKKSAGTPNESITHVIKKLMRETFGNETAYSFKALRKTTATYLAARSFGVDTLFLAHAPRTIAGLHYSRVSYERMHEYLCYAEADLLKLPLTKRWLGEKEKNLEKDRDG